MRGLVALLLALVAAPAHAQSCSINGVPCGTSQVESATVTLDTSGNATWIFSPSFPATPDITHMPIAVDAINPLICNYTARSTTAVSIHCWRTSLAGLLTGLLSGPVTGAQVNLIARYRPQ